MSASYLRVVACACAFVTVLTSPGGLLVAQDHTWTGAAGNDWLDPNNWSPAGTPEYIESLLISTGAPNSAGWRIDGGMVTVDGSSTIWTDSNNLGVHGASPTLNLTNGATVNVLGTTATRFDSGTVNILSGSKLNTQATVWIEDGTGPATPTVNVSGPGSTWTNNGFICVGWQSPARLNITDGGKVYSQRGEVSVYTSPAKLTIDGPGSEWDVWDKFSVGNDCTGEVQISNGGWLWSRSAALADGGMGGAGIVTVSGNNSRWQNDFKLDMDAAGNDNGSGYGSISVTDHALLYAGNPIIWANNPRHTSTLTVSDAGKFAGQQMIVGSRNYQYNKVPAGSGVLTVQSGGDVSFDKRIGIGSYTGAEVILLPYGTINLEGGSFMAPTIDRSAGGTFNFTGGGLQVNRFVGDLDNRGGALAACERAIAIVVEGNYTQDKNSLLELDIGNGAGDANSYGSLRTTGSMTLAGELHVNSWNHAFHAGELFDLLDFATIQGQFDTLSLPTLNGGLSWDSIMLYSDGTLRVMGNDPPPAVPEPMTLAMVGLAVAAAGAIARKSSRASTGASTAATKN